MTDRDRQRQMCDILNRDETKFNRFVRSQRRATVLEYNVCVPRFITEEVVLRIFLRTNIKVITMVLDSDCDISINIDIRKENKILSTITYCF